MDFDATIDEQVPRPLREFETGYEPDLGVGVNNTPWQFLWIWRMAFPKLWHLAEAKTMGISFYCFRGKLNEDFLSHTYIF
jgi:hypothetical protein